MTWAKNWAAEDGGGDEEGEDDGDGDEDRGGEAGWKGGKSGIGKLLGGGALLNAGPAHLLGVGDGPLSLGGEPLKTLSVLLALRGLCGDKGADVESRCVD